MGRKEAGLPQLQCMPRDACLRKHLLTGASRLQNAYLEGELLISKSVQGGTRGRGTEKPIHATFC